MASYKLYQEPIQKYRELNTTDWTPTFTIQANPTNQPLQNIHISTISIRMSFQMNRVSLRRHLFREDPVREAT